MKIWRVVCQEHAYFTASLCNAGLGNMIIMLLLASIIIYNYMNTFITLHQCTFNFLFALFSILIYQL